MKEPKKIYEKVVVQNPYLKVSEKRYEDENGNISSFLITGHNREKTIGTFVLPITQDGEILYLKEYRYGPEDFVINFPVGMLDDGVDEIENCKRELKEETGYFSEEIEFLGESIIENYFEGKVLYYIAKNCKKISNQDLEIGENIGVFKTSISEFEKMISDGKVLSSKTAYCFLLAKLKKYFSF
ncbi:MAG: NUDIX hydrolase [Candidatus Gracilibacteria bacterium]|nr:NUDIX hydrolase [Candidatus Gracilibacteria bacterium]